MSRLRVMVVDENEESRDEISRLMAKVGFDVYPAADGIDALRQIYQVMPQLIVSDAGLANLSGFEFLPFVRRRFPTIAVIAIGTQPSEPGRQSKFVPDKLMPRQPWDGHALLDCIDEVMARYALAGGVSDVDCA